MTNNQVVHNWRPSSRLLALMDKRLHDENILEKKLSSPPLDDAIIHEKFMGKVKTRAFNGLRRGILDGYFNDMTWDDFVEETKKPYHESKFYVIRQFGEESFNDIRRAIE